MSAGRFQRPGMKNIPTQVGYDGIPEANHLDETVGPGSAPPGGGAMSAQPVRFLAPQPVNIGNMPIHMAAPGGSPTVERSGTALALQNTTETVLRFSAELGQPMIFTRYRLIVDKIGFLSNVPGIIVPPYQFVPKIGGAPVLTNHGTLDPTTGLYVLSPFFPTMNRKTVGLNAPNGFDMVSDTGWIPCQVYLPAGRTFQWDVINGGAFDRYFTVHLEGYIANGSENIEQFSSVG